ncbi:mitochondrial 2-oxodicarboxylate carrier isoform X1 [Cricetulus griseus]|uniref:mitochondrial 2-oxodicarboxylate carrier isoform X1 n=1 Tax=Cricetulus griseus TaxID=10029 RepID=UPI00022F65B1|nr:mitochondrial 2-oxodicarboxylate carrier isoform X1 [Cricetulus griseus]
MSSESQHPRHLRRAWTVGHSLRKTVGSGSSLQLQTRASGENGAHDDYRNWECSEMLERCVVSVTCAIAEVASPRFHNLRKHQHLLRTKCPDTLFGFYKGIIPPILAETPKRAVKFSTFEQYKKLLGYVSLSPGLTFAIAGLGSGLTEAVVVNPFEVVKVGLQVNQHTFTEQPSTFAYARQIIKKEGWGLQGLNKGFTATLGRHGIFNMAYFGFYHNVKNIIPACKDPTLEFLRKFGIGFLSGTIGSIFNIPFDVAKSRIQGPQPVPGEIKYRKCLKTMATVYQEEGILALYRGLLPKVMRLGPGGAVMLLVYEHVNVWLQKNW